MRAMAVLSLVLFVAVVATPAFAQQPPPPQPGQPAQPAPAQQPAQPGAPQLYPNVATLEPFSAEANYMSLPGYLRWVVFQQTGQWLSRAEANRIVNQQTGTAGQ